MIRAAIWSTYGVWVLIFWLTLMLAVSACGAEQPIAWARWGCLSSPPAPAQRPVQAQGPTLGAATPEWTYPGDIYQHLAGTHGVTAAGLSHREAVVLHNRLHNAATNRVASPQITWQPTASSCPGGVCPAPTRTIVPARRGLFRRFR